jgi:undecaprenyl-diphosphatase
MTNRTQRNRAGATRGEADKAPADHVGDRSNQPASRQYWTHLFRAYVVGSIALFVLLALAARSIPYFPLDLTVARAVQSVPFEWFADLMFAVSWIGFAPQAWLISLTIIAFLYRLGRRWAALVTLIATAASDASVFGIKAIVEQPRPSADLIHVVNQLKDFSFPSGHVVYFTVFFGFLFYLTYNLAPRAWWRVALLALFGALILLVSVSRVYEGQHWPSDTLGSYLLGSDWLILTILVYRWGGR